MKIYNNILPVIKVRNHDINYTSIDTFNIGDIKNNNDNNNKIREVIIESIINNYIPEDYYEKSSKWKKLKEGINDYIKFLIDNNTIIETVKCIHKGGRQYHYDFEIIINNIYIYTK